jgi:hypothetical protein
MIIAPTKYRIQRGLWVCNPLHGIKVGSTVLTSRKQFWRLSRAGVFALFSEARAALSEAAHLVQMFDLTIVRTDVSARVDAALRKTTGKSDD